MALYPSLKSGSRTDQTVAVLTDLITSGQLSSGEFLPSVAELSRQLGVSYLTIRLGLRTFESRGLVVTPHLAPITRARLQRTLK